MNTPSHIIINLVALGRSQPSSFNLPIVLGSLLPDIAIFWFYFWAKVIKKSPSSYIWSQAYFSPFWQNIFAVPNSFVLCTIGVAIAVYFRQLWWIMLFLSMILHLLCDFPVHHDDAHRHFFPLSNYRFFSPISYWDSRHYGTWVALVELIIVLGCSVYLWSQFPQWWVRGLLLINGVFYSTVYLLFYVKIHKIVLQ